MELGSAAIKHDACKADSMEGSRFKSREHLEYTRHVSAHDPGWLKLGVESGLETLLGVLSFLYVFCSWKKEINKLKKKKIQSQKLPLKCINE